MLEDIKKKKPQTKKRKLRYYRGKVNVDKEPNGRSNNKHFNH